MVIATEKFLEIYFKNSNINAEMLQQSYDEAVTNTHMLHEVTVTKRRPYITTVLQLRMLQWKERDSEIIMEGKLEYLIKSGQTIIDFKRS